jgi:cytochrome c5
VKASLALALALAVSACIAPALRAEGPAGGEKADSDPLAASSARVFPILRRSCVGCHGSQKQSGKLRLDAAEHLLKGGRRGGAVVPGKAAESLVVQRVSAQGEERMPPEGKGEPLSAEEVEAIRKWIDAGAKVDAVGAGAEPSAVEVKVGALPAGYAPVFALAGDSSASRFAVGRGGSVEVYSVPSGTEAAKKDGAKKDESATQPELLVRLEGHADAVQSLAFSPDGKLLASGEFRIVRVWRTDDWSLHRTLDGHADRVLALAFSPDAKRLAAAGGLPSESGEVRAWDLEGGDDRGRTLWSVAPHSDAVLGLDWSRDGKSIITAGADRVTYVLAAESGKTLRRLEGHTHHVLGAALSPEGKQAASVGGDGKLRVWDLENGLVVQTANAHSRAATRVVYRDDGKEIVTAGEDGQVRVWSEKGQEKRSFTEAKGAVQAAGLFLGSKRCAAAEQEGTVRVYDLEKNRLLYVLEGGGRG